MAASTVEMMEVEEMHPGTAPPLALEFSRRPSLAAAVDIPPTKAARKNALSGVPVAAAQVGEPAEDGGFDEEEEEDEDELDYGTGGREPDEYDYDDGYGDEYD